MGNVGNETTSVGAREDQVDARWAADDMQEKWIDGTMRPARQTAGRDKQTQDNYTVILFIVE